MSIVGTSSVGLLYLFLAFQLVDQIFLPILITTFLLSKSVKRHPTVVNVCMTWIISGLTSSLLFYAGKQVGPEPPKMLCMSQASLLDGVLPMVSVAVLALMYQINFSTRNPKAIVPETWTYALIIAPYITFFSFATVGAIIAVQKPEQVTRARRFFYCSFASPITNVFAVFSALVLITALGYAVSVGVYLRQNWYVLRQASSLDLQFVCRVAVFGVYVFLSLVMTVLSIFAPSSPFPDLFAASIGTALFLIFSTQPDVWRAWLGRAKPVPPSVPTTWVTSDADGSKIHAFGETYISAGLNGSKELGGTVDVSAQLTALRCKSLQRHSLTEDTASTMSDSFGAKTEQLHHFDRSGMV